MPYSSLRMIPILIVSIFVKLKILLLATAMIDGSTCHKIVIWRYRLTIFVKSLLFTLLSKNFMTFFNSSIMSDRIFVHTPGVPVGMWTCPHQVLAATLTLFQPGGQVMPTLYWCPHQVLKATGAGGTGYAHFITPRFLDVLTALPSQTAKLSWEGTLSYYLSSAVSAAHPCLQRSSCSD